MHEPTSLPRVDLNSIKERLKQALKDQSSAYWELLRKFMQAKLSKKEFDYYARSILADEITSPPLTQPPAPAGKKPPVPKRPVGKEAKPPKGGKPDAPPRPPRPAVSKGPRQVVKEVPLGAEHNVLRQRMQRIVTEAGLNGLTHDSIRVMMTAVEHYAKRVVSASHPTYRPHPTLPSNTAPPVPYVPLSSSLPHPRISLLSPSTLSSSQQVTAPGTASSLQNNAQVPQQKFNTVTLQDLHQASALHPSLFGDDFLVNQERVAIALM